MFRRSAESDYLLAIALALFIFYCELNSPDGRYTVTVLPYYITHAVAVDAGTNDVL